MRKSVVVLVAVLCSLIATSYLADESGRFLFPILAPEIEEQLDSRRAARLRGLSTSAYGERWHELARNAEALGEGLARAGHRDPRTFAVVAAYRALAAAALGEDLDAIWHWQVTLNLWSDIDYAELTPPFSAQLVIGVDGRHHSPRVHTSTRQRGAEAYSALEALRRWRYTPTMVNGEPAEAFNMVEQTVGKPPAGSRWRRF